MYEADSAKATQGGQMAHGLVFDIVMNGARGNGLISIGEALG